MSLTTSQFTEKLKEEVINVMTNADNVNAVSVFESLRNQTSISSSTIITNKSDEIFSRLSSKINHLLLSISSSSLSTCIEELIQNLKLHLSSTITKNNDEKDDKNLIPLTVQQQLAYLLAMYHLAIHKNQPNNNGKGEKDEIGKMFDFINLFLNQKLQYFHQYYKDATVTNDNDTNDGQSFILVLQESMTFYISLIDHLLLLNMQHLKNDVHQSNVINDQLCTLRNEFKTVLSMPLPSENEQQVLQQGQLDVTTKQSLSLESEIKSSLQQPPPAYLQEMDLPEDSIKQLQTLYQEDIESFKVLEPYLTQMYTTRSTQEIHHYDQEQSTKFTPNYNYNNAYFIRPLPPLSNFSNKVDLFDYDNDCNDETLNIFNTSMNVEMKDDDDTLKSKLTDNNKDTTTDNTGTDTSNQSGYDDSYQDRCNKMLFFLHPTDPFLRFVYMNTTSLYHNEQEHQQKQKLSTETHMSTLVEDDDMIDTFSLSGGIDQHIHNDLIQLLEEAFVRSLDANEEEKVLQFMTKATALSSSTSMSTSTNATTAATSDSTKFKNNQRINTMSLYFQQMLSIVLECGLTPENLHKLVKYNHNIAYHCILMLLLANNNNNDGIDKHQHDKDSATFVSSSLTKDYLSALVVGMDISLESMEVVYQLATYSHDFVKGNYNDQNSDEKDDSPVEATAEKKRKSMVRRSTSSSTKTYSHQNISSESSRGKVLLSTEYIHMFVSNFISSCENTQDRNRRFKYVRLLSVFLQTLIQKGIVTVEDIYIEVQQFCINFSRVEEAASLFKLLKESRSKR